VLAILLRASPAVVPVERICAELSTSAEPVRRATIDARVKSLRRKLGHDRIETRAGFGYAFVPRAS
jgi:DNA-binding response OmpR family regulator